MPENTVKIKKDSLMVLLVWAQGQYDNYSCLMRRENATELRDSIVEAYETIGNNRKAKIYREKKIYCLPEREFDE